ncbi:MAG: cupin domain-containing protein [Spirochaetales bacterium]|nr:cupin domain-containing protein [Spirochaetales bacterium]
MQTAEYWIHRLGLVNHPEGGFFRETYRSPELIVRAALPARFSGERCFSTCIYYLLQRDEFSAFHRIRQDEIWHLYDGSGVFIHIINEEGIYSRSGLATGSDSESAPQVTVPAGSYFAAELMDKSSFTLCGCTVAPGFDFADFELPSPEFLIERFPGYGELIGRLTRHRET